MKTTLKKGTLTVTAVTLFLCAMGAILHAQTDHQTSDDPLQPVASGDIPDGAAFFRLSEYLRNGGTLGGPYPYLMDTNAAVYSLNSWAYLVDDASITNDDDLAATLSLLAQPLDSFSRRLMGGMTMDAADLEPVMHF